MRKLWKYVLVLWAMGMGIAMGAPALAASANGPYYATPSWDQKLDAATRFVVLLNWNSDAVLDRETGLVWEKVPSTPFFDWANASIHCVQLNLGGRKGWRLPTIQDLASLIDPNQSNPALPSGHPFTVPSTEGYWSATARAATNVWLAGFGDGGVGFGPQTLTNVRAWCVRGGAGVDDQ